MNESSMNYPQEAYRWSVRFKGIALNDSQNYSGEDIHLFARNTGLPAMSQESINRYYRGVPYSVVGKETSPRIFRITFWDSHRLDIYHYFQRWYRLSQDRESNRSVAQGDYKRQIILELEAPNGDINEAWTFDDAFPTEISEAVLSYDASEPFTFDVLMNFSRRWSGREV